LPPWPRGQAESWVSLFSLLSCPDSSVVPGGDWDHKVTQIKPAPRSWIMINDNDSWFMIHDRLFQINMKMMAVHDWWWMMTMILPVNGKDWWSMIRWMVNDTWMMPIRYDDMILTWLDLRWFDLMVVL
jgi:hypothetical protein